MSIYNPEQLKDELIACPLGWMAWRRFEIICNKILTYLFVPPLYMPKSQVPTRRGHRRRDVIFSNRNVHTNNVWAILRTDYNAHYIVVDFKNYDLTDIKSNEVSQLCNYLLPHIGRFGILVCSKTPKNSAYEERKSRFGRSDDKKLVIFLMKENLIEMIDMKIENDNPENFIFDKIDNFLLSYDYR